MILTLMKKMNNKPFSHKKQELKKAVAVPWTNVLRIKTKAENILTNMNDFSFEYIRLIEEYFKVWFATINDEDYEKIYTALSLIWTLLADIKHDPNYFKKIFNTRIEDLDLSSKFEKVFLCFIIDPEDTLNVHNLKKYLKEYALFVDELEPWYTYLYEFLDFILEATAYQINNNDDFKIWLSFTDSE